MNDPSLVCASGPWDLIGNLRRVVCGGRGKRAADFHDATEIILKRDGWIVHREYSVPGGRIDLVANIGLPQGGIVSLALELDNRRPRKKSIEKLQALGPGWITGVVLRNPK